MSLNKVMLIGRLGGNPEMRQTKTGTAVANFNLATSEVYMDKDGQRQDKTEWHRIVVWGKQADLCAQYLAKGRQVFIEGKLQTRQWQDQQGQNRYTTEIIASNVRFLDSNRGERSEDLSQEGPAFEPANNTAADDIPF